MGLNLDSSRWHSNTQEPLCLGLGRQMLTTYTQATHRQANPMERAPVMRGVSPLKGMNTTTTMNRPVMMPGRVRLKTPPAPCPYMTKNSWIFLGSITKQHAKHTQRNAVAGLKTFGTSGTVVRRKFMPQAARIQPCTAFSSNILAWETALSIFSITANRTKPPKCSPGCSTLRDNEISAALHRQTTAGMKLIANVRSMGVITGFWGMGD